MFKKLILSSVFVSILLSDTFQNINIEGLSSKRVLSATQDSSGFVWIGTDEGLNRFDGYLNKTYRSNVYKENTLSGNRIWISYIDRNNTLWIGTDRGVCYYNENEDEFTRIETGSKPLHVIEDESSVYFTTTSKGVVKVSKKTKETSFYQFDPLDPFSLSSSRFSDLQTNPIAKEKDHLWVGTTNGLNQVNIKTGQIKRFYSGKTDLVKADSISSVLVTQRGLYTGTTKGLTFLGSDQNENIKDITDKNVVALFEIKEANLVAAVLKDEIQLLEGIKVVKTIKIEKPFTRMIDLKTGQYLFTSKSHKRTLFLTIENKTINYTKSTVPIKPSCVFVDLEGGIWLAGNKGLLRAGNTTNPVSVIEGKPIKPGRFSKTKNGLFVLREKQVFKYSKNSQETKVTDLIKTTENEKLYVSEDNDMFIYDKAVEKINKNGNREVIIKFKKPISTIFSKGDNLFISFKHSGLVYHNLKTNKTTDYRKNRLLSRNLPAGATSFHLEGKKLWLGNDESGLYELDVTNIESPKLVQHHTYDRTNPKSFSSSSVSCITNHSGLLFIGTSGDGFFIYDKKDFTKLSLQDGLPSNNIISFAGSSDSTIWVLTNAGVSLVDWANTNVSNIGPEEGLGAYLKDQNSLYNIKEGSVLVASPSGVQEVDANKLYTNEYEATTAIESIELIDRQNKKHTIGKTNVKSTHTTPIIKINLTAPSIYKAKNTTFSYYVENYHTDWVENGTRRYIELQGLKTGEHKVKIKSYNNDGYESKNTAELKFQIIPPWWETWWAYLTYTIIMASGVFYYIKYQTKAQQKAAEDKRKEEELEEARQFQLDMLPRETPNYLDLDISAAIQTASEVGGDYYDYFPQEDKKSLYVVVGDATGHGMTAGMMVSITKAGLYGIPSIPPNEIATRLNRVIKAIDLGLNRMAFNMARFWEDKVEFTSAAMPPAYHYRAKTKDVDEILLGGLPLGSIKDETFSLEEFSFEKGDSLIFISDGLPEATNKENEMLGYEAVFECVKSNGEKNAESQKQALLDLGTSWLGDLQNQDDITIVVVKKTISLD